MTLFPSRLLKHFPTNAYEKVNGARVRRTVHIESIGCSDAGTGQEWKDERGWTDGGA